MRILLSAKKRLIIASLSGVVVAGAVFLYLNREEQRLNSQFVMTTVLQAKRYIPPGKLILAQHVQEVHVPQITSQPTALKSVRELVNKQGEAYLKPRIGFLKGEQITRSRLTDSIGFVDLSWSLEPNRAALALSLSPEQAVGGHLKPGNWVSVLCLMDKQPDWSKPTVRSLVERARVMAMGERIMNDGEPINKEGSSSFSSNEPALVTLDLSLEDAARVALGAEKGKIVLVLLSSLDTATKNAVRIDFNDLK